MLKNYACKHAPDSTIVRIEALEKLGKSLQDQNAKFVDKEAFEELKKRVVFLEAASKQTNERVSMAEEEIEALKRMIQAMGSIGNNTTNIKMDSNVDVTKILMQISMLQETIKQKPDRHELEKVKNESHTYTDKEIKSSQTQLTGRDENLKHEIDRLRAEFEQHKTRDFTSLVERVVALEKKVNQILA